MSTETKTAYKAAELTVLSTQNVLHERHCNNVKHRFLGGILVKHLLKGVLHLQRQTINQINTNTHSTMPSSNHMYTYKSISRSIKE